VVRGSRNRGAKRRAMCRSQPPQLLAREQANRLSQLYDAPEVTAAVESIAVEKRPKMVA
jgi:hypothetical protein